MSCVFIISTLSFILTVVIICIDRVGCKCQIPPWVRKWIMGKLAKCLFMQHEIPRREFSKSTLKNIQEKITKNGNLARVCENGSLGSSALNCNASNRNVQMEAKRHPEFHDLKELSSLLKDLLSQMKGEEQDTILAEEWKAVAKVLDRLFFFFVLFLLILVGSVMAWYCQSF